MFGQHKTNAEKKIALKIVGHSSLWRWGLWIRHCSESKLNENCGSTTIRSAEVEEVRKRSRKNWTTTWRGERVCACMVLYTTSSQGFVTNFNTIFSRSEGVACSASSYHSLILLILSPLFPFAANHERQIGAINCSSN